MVRCDNGYTLWYLVFFSLFANGLNERYPELFDGDGSSSQHQINFGRKWRAYSTIFELAEGDLEKIDRVVEEPLEKCLLFLAYKSDKNRLEAMIHREAMKSIK